MATIERLNTDILNEDTILHLHRYAIACNYTKNKVVLDIASGEGYGCNLISKNASFVYGVDIDKETIVSAKNKYNEENIEFIEGSTSEIPLDDCTIDIVISFETIEHHDKHEEMFKEIKRVLKPKGLLIISTPDKYYYSDIKNYNNEFHIKELYKQEFIKLIKNFFTKYQILSQSYLNGNSLIFNKITRNKINFYSGNYLEFMESTSNPEFLIAVISNFDFDRQENSIFDGRHILSKNLIKREMLEKVYNSNSFKIGHFVLFPLKILKRNLKKFILK